MARNKKRIFLASRVAWSRVVDIFTRQYARMPFRVTEIQATPNPNAVKFLLDRPVSAESISFLNTDQGRGHPIAERLFAIAGVSSLLFLGDFITVNKDAAVSWAPIKRSVRKVLTDV